MGTLLRLNEEYQNSSRAQSLALIIGETFSHFPLYAKHAPQLYSMA